MSLTPFHLAIQVRDIEEAREFYGAKLGFEEGTLGQIFASVFVGVSLNRIEFKG